MITSLRSLDQLTDLATEGAVVVVGSGPAGLAVAHGLERAGRRVVLLESGPEPGSEPARRAEVDDLQRGEVAGAPYSGVTQGRARGLGGTSQLWAGQCVRMHPQDTAPRPWIGSPGWPLEFEELERWYPAAESFLGVSGRGYGRERWAEHPTRSRMDWDEHHLADDFTEITDRLHLGERHHEALRASRLVTVVTGATVTAVVLDRGHVRGVEVADHDGRRVQLDAPDVVLACGALENARILMISDPQGVGLGSGAAHTGRHLQDHVMITTVDLEPMQGIWLQDNYSHLHQRGCALWPKVRLSEEAQREAGLLSATVTVIHEHDSVYLAAASRLCEALRTRELTQGSLRSTLRDAAAVVTGALPLARAAWRRWRHGLGSGIPASRTSLMVLAEQSPQSESRVSLAQSTDHLGLRRIVVDWQLGPGEIESSRQVTRWVVADLESAGIAHARERAVMTDDAAWRADAIDAHHPSGTTRMSSDADEGVVDPHGQVHGVRGLHVVGSSTFPVAGYANPTLTIVAMALRLADRLASAPSDRSAATRHEELVTT